MLFDSADSSSKCNTLVVIHFFKKTSQGVLYPNVFLGLLFDLFTASCTDPTLKFIKDIFFRKYCLNNPFVFSFNPLSHEA